MLLKSQKGEEEVKLTVNRLRNNGDTTIGELLIDGVKMCDTLEDEPREKKVMHETRIPANEYKITFRTVGGFHSKHLARYGEDFHKGMLWIKDVPGFEYILIHSGNTDEHTSGCLLVGTASGWVLNNSRKAYEKIYPIVRDALIADQSVTITYNDLDL